jgi:ubiquinone/menaquinone biosynthesis C-methylase UbiE
MTADFDKISRWYDIPLNQIYFKILYKKAICFIDEYLKSGDKLLDIGCGTGNWLVSLQKINNLNLFGLDRSRGMINRAAGKSNAIDLSMGKAESLPYGSGEFNFVTIIESFHHFDNHKQALLEARRVLCNKGYIFLLDPSLDGWAKFIWLGTKIFVFERASKYLYFKNLTALIRESGFMIIKSKIKFGNNWILAQKY